MDILVKVSIESIFEELAVSFTGENKPNLDISAILCSPSPSCCIVDPAIIPTLFSATRAYLLTKSCHLSNRSK